MSRIVLPGDFISSESRLTDTKLPKLIGHGLEKRNDGVYAVLPGVLNESDNKIWLTTSGRRFLFILDKSLFCVLTNEYHFINI